MEELLTIIANEERFKKYFLGHRKGVPFQTKDGLLFEVIEISRVPMPSGSQWIQFTVRAFCQSPNLRNGESTFGLDRENKIYVCIREHLRVFAFREDVLVDVKWDTNKKPPEIGG